MTGSLQQVVEVLARPIESARRAPDARVPDVKNLGEFVRSEILAVLAREVFAPTVETDLLVLRQLFSDYHDTLPLKERQTRLARARAILSRLGSRGGTAHGHASHAAPLWDIPIRFVKGVGPKRAALLERVGIRTVEDALWYLPRRYEDRSVVTPIAQLRPGTRATVSGAVTRAKLRRTQRRGITLFEIQIEDGTGALPCLYYNQPYLEGTLKPGTTIMACGTVSAGRRSWKDVRMDSPQFEMLGDESDALLHVGRIVPIYSETKGLTSRQFRTIVKGLLDEYGPTLTELIPRELLARHDLPELNRALADVHFPPPGTTPAALDRGTTPAHRRLAFEELFVLELALAMRQRSVKEEVKGIRFDVDTPVRQKLRRRLPFQLTTAQQRVLDEIARDMGAPRPMNRLIQGDVGCGKTVVALHAIVMACGSGYQAALMVPTEILAEQHYLNLRELLHALGLKAVVLRSGGSTKVRIQALEAIRTGEADVVIGTHALIQKGVEFSRLGLAVIDEQHKFGVLQRKTLVDKGHRSDVLVLTATPIPRTLAMTVYGDLDLSVIDRLPPGRKPIRTMVFGQSRRRRAYDLVRNELKAGRQAYIVYPLVEESEKSDLQAVLQGAERLQAEEFPSFSVRVLHGRMKTDDKERTMRAFKDGTIDVLVATTVVEVGVDVANATVMVVEHAERFGLAQLHQLRGRVGRGAEQSYCLLLTSGRWSETGSGAGSRRRVEEPLLFEAPVAPSHPRSAARHRLEALVGSADGFVIAEEDLKIRGPGEFFGTRQWGVPEFRAANLIRDGAMLEQARQDAFALLAADPTLSLPTHRSLRDAMLRRWQAKLELGEIG